MQLDLRSKIDTIAARVVRGSSVVSKPIQVPESLRFGDDFELDLRAYELREAGRPLKLERIPMDLLVLLVEHRGVLVTRGQIIEKIWGKDVFLDTDASINSAVRKIRQVLKDDPEQPRFVQTVSGKGYRFIAPVEGAAPAAGVVAEPPPVSVENLLGKKISHYRVLELLGGGGMGVVYKAEDLKLGRLVALKFLPSEAASDTAAFERLQREAQAASSLDHPNICSIYQFGEHEGQPFIVMQCLEGETLRDWIETYAADQPASRVKSVVDIAIQIADGLEAAHEKGIIHRDIKPANLFVTTRGQAKILDFGVAKFMDAEPELCNSSGPSRPSVIPIDPQSTRTGVGLGTPSYLSPEQVRRDRLDARTDLFSFGLVLYEMATGQRAFAGDTAAAIRDAVSSQDVVPPRQLVPEIPPELERIVTKSLEKDPSQRYQSAKDLLVDLRGLEGKLHPVSPSRIIWLSAAAGLLLLALGIFAFNVAGIRDRIFRGGASSETAQFKARPSVAVLGFKNLSGRDDEEWISTALSEMLNAELASGQQVRVIPGENVARMKVDLSLPSVDSYAQDTLSRIRNHLSTDMVVHGSYLALGKDSGGKVRIDLELQDTTAGETMAVFSQTGTESDLADLISLGGASLRQRLGIGQVSAGDAGQVRSSIPSNPEATRLYSEGLAKLRNFDALAASDLLTKAIASDSNHALSHAALSESWSALGFDQKARDEAKKAVDLSAKLSREDQLWVEGRYREATHEWQKAVDAYNMLWGFFPDNLEYGLRLSRAQGSAGLGKESMATIDSLRKIPPPSGNDPRIDLAEATAADQLGDLRREEAAAAKAVEKGRKLGERSLTARALLTRGSVLSALGDHGGALASLNEARAIYADVGDQQGVARVLNNLGILQRHQSNLVEAQKTLEQALEIFRRIGNKGGMVLAYNNLGNALWDQGDMARTLVAHQQSLALSREVGDKKSEATSLNNLGGLLTLDGKLAEARQRYDESLHLAYEVGDQEGAGIALGNIADLLTRQGDLAVAKKTADEALAVHKKVGDKTYEAYALQQLGTVLASQGDLNAARTRYQEAIAVRHELGEKTTEAQSQFSLAQLQLDSGDAASAEAGVRRVVPIFHDASSRDDEALSYSLLSLALLAQGKQAEAQQAAAKSNEVLTKVQDFATRLQIDLANAYIEGMTGASSNDAGNRIAHAMKALESVRETAARQGYAGLELEARLRLGEVELHSGKTAVGRSRLEQLVKDARAKDFTLISRKAKAALESSNAH